jgi:hypothetical protein
MKGSQESLTTVVVKDAAMWPTPQAQDTQRTPEAYAAAKEKRGGKMFLSLNIAAQLHGQAAPANPSTDGSRQGLWQTATVSTGAHRQRDGSMIPKLDSQVGGKLNPRWVETLMGLPVGWVMPSCASPVTIALTNCDSSATESSQQQQRELFEC